MPWAVQECTKSTFNIAIQDTFEKVHTTTEYNTISKNYIPISPQNTLFSLLSQPVCVYDVQSVLTLSINLLDQLQRTRPLG